MVGSIRQRLGWTATGVALVLAASACFPDPNAPTEQAVPPGGTVVATSPGGTSLEIEDATSDLSRIVMVQSAVPQFGQPFYPSFKYSLYDAATGTTTELPIAHDLSYTSVTISNDGQTIVFSSTDPALQVGPVAMNCRRYEGFFQPLTPIYCSELYVLDPDTGAVRQLTGLAGSSVYHNVRPDLSDDGTTVDFLESSLIPESGGRGVRLTVATGSSVVLPYTGRDREWNRGSTIVFTNGGQVSVEVVATGVTTVVSGPEAAEFLSSAGNGHFVVVEHVDGTVHLIDTDARTDRTISGSWVDDDASRFVLIQNNVAPSGGGRVIIAPLAPLAP